MKQRSDASDIFEQTLTRRTFAASLILHGLIVAAILISFRQQPGAIEQKTEAISVNIVASEVLAAVENSSKAEASAKVSGAQSSPARPQEEPEEKKPAPEEKPHPEKAAEQPVKPAESAPRRAEAEAEAEEVAETAEEALRKAQARRLVLRKIAERREAMEKKAEELRKVQRQAAARPGAAAGERGASASQARVSASTGSIQTYGALVRARIEANKPAGLTFGRSVVIALSISQTGGLASVGIAQSSGDAATDQAALSAVRRSSPFPPPPNGARASFTIPFIFR